MAQDWKVEIGGGMAAIDAAAWDRLGDPDDPFTSHAFLHLLERSGSVAPETGWTPAHVLVRDRDGGLVGGAPAYVKTHSYGEYIFDWGWAEAAQRAGVPYYPKVVVAVPFTPATGDRLRVAPGVDATAVREALLAGLRHLAEVTRAGGLHLLFTSQSEWEALCPHDQRDRRGVGPRGLIPRETHQYHWHNQGYADFEAWLDGFRHKSRKEVRRERRRVEELGVEVEVLRGDALGPEHWAAVHAFYQATIEKKWSQEYLQPAFWTQAVGALGDLPLLLLARKGGEPVAASLLFQRGRALFGRYWGCQPGFEALHFELCYHRPIELCIEAGWQRFEAGAQGAHKIKRGLMPARTFSVHWLRHQGLAAAVAEACQQEAQELALRFPEWECHGPFRRGEEGG
jgi:uncharacterized protein